MNTTNIRNILQNDEYASIHFVDVCSRDQFLSSLYDKTDDVSSFVVNSHYSHQPGEHWLAIVCAEDSAIYFDSYGRHPIIYPDIWKKLMYRYEESKIYYSNKQIQGLTSSTCGDYCTYFLLLLARGWSPEEIFNVLLNINSNELRDHAVRRFILSYFGNESVSELYHSSVSGIDGVHIQLAIPFLSAI